MKLKSYRDDLLKRLSDPSYATGYVEETLASGDQAAFLLALKDVVDAGEATAKSPIFT
jgi:hypothetical protein